MALLGGGCDGNCAVANQLRAELARLQAQNDELFRTNLVLVDAKAHAALHPRPTPPRQPGAQPGPDRPMTPGEFREHVYRSPMSTGEIEASFAAESAAANAQAGATHLPGKLS